MNRIVISSGLLATVIFAADRLSIVDRRLSQLEHVPETPPALARGLARQVSSLRGELESTRAAIEADRRADELATQLAMVNQQLERERNLVAELSTRLSSWDERLTIHAPEAIDQRVLDLSVDAARRNGELEELRELSHQLSELGRTRWEALRTEVEPLLAARDEERMWNELVGPVVQLAGDATVGSGVLLESKPRSNGEGWVTHLLTSWHVVRDIYGSLDKVNKPVPVRMYAPDGSGVDLKATMVAYDVALDVALLEMDLNTPVKHGARLARRERLDEMRVFDGIYAVGCPLGNDPIPTAGEIASTAHMIDGNKYWMISAPTYIGNSGGGIFDAKTHDLVGIFSKIYTHGAARSTIVPHMGLATPLPVIYDWLDRAGHASLVGVTPRAQTASAAKH